MELSHIDDLPLGSLESALADFTTDAVPLLSPEEAIDLHNELDHFIANEGPLLEAKLHAMLNALQAKNNHKNWLHEFWINSYLSERAPIQTALNYCTHIENPLMHHAQDPAENLAQWMLNVALTYSRIRKKKPRFFRRGNRNFCIEQALPFFECIRQPKADIDECQMAEAMLDQIALHYHGKIYLAKVLDKKCHPVDLSSLKDCIQQIFSNQTSSGTANNFSVIADLGSDAANQFLSDWLPEGDNKEQFNELTQCICHIYISDSPYNESIEAVQATLMNSQGHLWPYIPLNFIFWVNSEISLLTEHSLIDATTLGFLVNEMKQANSEKKRIKKPAAEIKPVEFSYSENSLQQLATAKNNSIIKPNYYQSDNLTLNFSHDHYSIDALAQLMFQFAQYQIDGTLRSIYAPCAMNHFHLGRTETIRSISGASKAFIKAFTEGLFDNDLFIKSIDEYRLHIKRTKIGKGYQRHLTLLKHFAEEDAETCDFFQSTAWSKLAENFYSTSNAGELGNPFNQFYFVPPAGAKIGIGYLIKDTTLRICSMTYQKDKDYLHETSQQFNEFVKRINPHIDALYHSTHASN
ncbi:MAG: choline/carnitine O-acyltransferase [Cellvibrionales bacterium]|nr:choline/carnitine O-acyltransferase [Cellvibrionales bacterium]